MTTARNKNRDPWAGAGVSQLNAAADAPIEVSLGRAAAAPFSQLPDWIGLSEVSNNAKALFWHLHAHLNMKRGDKVAWPSRSVLAELMGLKQARSVDRYLAELADLGAIEVQHRYREGTRMRTTNRYLVHEEPPSGYPGVRSLPEWYRIRRKTAA